MASEGAERKCSLAETTDLQPSGLRTMADTSALPSVVHVTVTVPDACCPVSRNPRPGSSLTLSYRPQGRVLEVYALKAYLRWFVGGHPSGERNMEGMIGLTARDAAAALGVRVKARAALVLDTGEMVLTMWGRP